MFGPMRYVCFVLLALAGSLATAAVAQDGNPALRAEVTVTGELVRIGDMVENAGAVADVPIFRAPDLGTRGAVATDRVIEAIRPHQLIGIDTRGLTEVIVTRASRAITGQEIAARIARVLEGQYGLGEARNIQISFDRDVRTIHVEAGAIGSLQVISLFYNPRTNGFDAVFDLPASAAWRRLAPRFTGTAVETVDAVAVDHPMERGEMVRASDLAVARRPKSEGTVITDPKAVVGLAVRHQLRPGQPLHEADLMKPMIVQRNETVTIIYEAPGLTLTLRGQAQDAGALGDTIGVLNVQSKRVVQGIVSGPGRVTVAATPTRLVENTSPPAPDAPATSLQTPLSPPSRE